MQIQENISLKDKNWFRTGGAARYYCEPESELEVKIAVKFAQEQKLPIFVLGEGANILISDTGYPGLVIAPKLKQIELDPTSQSPAIRAGAGVRFQDLIDFCLAHKIVGLEDFSGIPGTVGGSVYINIHYFEHLLSDFLQKATVVSLSTGETQEVDREWFEFGYDTSTLHSHKHILTDATFSSDKMKKVSVEDTAYARGRRDEIIRQRERKYPTSGTCGSFFRNFKPEDRDFANLPEINGRKMIYIAYYLDNLGIKGNLRVGDAIVSTKHANMIENLGKATSSDIIQLTQKMQKMVHDKYGITPEIECQMVGF